MRRKKSFTQVALERLWLPGNAEYAIQNAIVDYLRVKKIFVFAIPNGAFFFIKNPVTRILIYLIGLLPGVSDLIVLKSPGKAVFLEVKTKTGRQSDLQKLFQKNVEDLGFKYYVCRSLDDVDKYILKGEINA